MGSCFQQILYLKQVSFFVPIDIILSKFSQFQKMFSLMLTMTSEAFGIEEKLSNFISNNEFFYWFLKSPIYLLLRIVMSSCSQSRDYFIMQVCSFLQANHRFSGFFSTETDSTLLRNKVSLSLSLTLFTQLENNFLVQCFFLVLNLNKKDGW